MASGNATAAASDNRTEAVQSLIVEEARESRKRDTYDPLVYFNTNISYHPLIFAQFISASSAVSATAPWSPCQCIRRSELH